MRSYIFVSDKAGVSGVSDEPGAWILDMVYQAFMAINDM